MEILVADDDPMIALMLSTHFRKAGYGVTVARDTMQAIMLALRKPPDAVLLDVMMPGGSGLQVLRQLKNSVKTALVPIVVISGSIDSSTVDMVKQLGADAFMKKPPDLPQLLELVRQLTETRVIAGSV